MNSIVKDFFICFILPCVASIIVVIVVIISLNENDKVKAEYHDKMNSICAPFFFVEQERAADHLTRVKCLSEQGEKKEILIKDDAK